MTNNLQAEPVDEATGIQFVMKSGKGQSQTMARFNGTNCPRAAISQAIMVEALMGPIPAQYRYFITHLCGLLRVMLHNLLTHYFERWNMDASTMIAMALGKGRTQYCVYRRSPFKANGEQKKGFCRAMKLETPLTTIRYQQDMNVFIKWNQMQNGAGDFGPLIFIVAVKGLKPGEFYCAVVKGVTNGSNNTVRGYVYFAATRCMSAAPDALDQQDDEEGIFLTVAGANAVPAAQVMTTPTANAAAPNAQVIDTPIANVAVLAAQGIATPTATPTASAAVPMSSIDSAMTPWQHLLTTLMIPTVHDYAVEYNMLDDTGHLYHSRVAIDGEMVILKETQKPAFQELLKKYSVQMAKCRASGTEFDNACGMYLYFIQPISYRNVTPSKDAGDNFRDKNTGLRALEATGNGVYANNFLKGNLTAAFKELKQQFPHVSMTAHEQDKAKDAIMRLVYVMKEGYVSSTKAEIGMFRCGFALPAGIRPTRVFLGFEATTVNAYRILTELCSYGFSSEELDLIYEHGPALIEFFKQYGRLTTPIMDQYGFPKVLGIESRDEKTISQQGNYPFPPYIEVPSVILTIITGPLDLTHADTLARTAAFAVRSVAKEQANQLAAAKSLCAKADAEEEQKRSLEAEKIRVAALSPAQKKELAVAKKLIAEERKKALNDKKVLKQQKLDNARLMVGAGHGLLAAGAGIPVLAAAVIPRVAVLRVNLDDTAAEPMQL